MPGPQRSATGSAERGQARARVGPRLRVLSRACWTAPFCPDLGGTGLAAGFARGLARPSRVPNVHPSRRPRHQHQLLGRAHPPGSVLQDVGGVRQVHRVWTQVCGGHAPAPPHRAQGCPWAHTSGPAPRSRDLPTAPRWFCHVDDDNYVNPGGLLQLLSAFSPSQDIYLGRPSLDHPIEATERAQGGGTVSAGPGEGQLGAWRPGVGGRCGGWVRSPDWRLPPPTGDHCQVLVRHRWGRLLPEQRPRPQDEPLGQVIGGRGARAARVGVRRQYSAGADQPAPPAWAAS